MGGKLRRCRNWSAGRRSVSGVTARLRPPGSPGRSQGIPCPAQLPDEPFFPGAGTMKTAFLGRKNLEPEAGGSGASPGQGGFPGPESSFRGASRTLACTLGGGGCDLQEESSENGTKPRERVRVLGPRWEALGTATRPGSLRAQGGAATAPPGSGVSRARSETRPFCGSGLGGRVSEGWGRGRGRPGAGERPRGGGE